jgi:membrane-associated phospholipid phosphatase
VLVLAWHFPSDVLGGFLVAGGWALGMIAVLALIERDPGPRTPRASWQAAGVLLTLGAAAALAAVTAAVVTHPAAAGIALAHPSFLAVAVAVAALAATVALGVSRAVEA